LHRRTRPRALIALIALLMCVPAAPTAGASWVLIREETFEGTFPGNDDLWAVVDRNGSTVGGSNKWNDVPSKPRQGYWSANPAGNEVPYPDLQDTSMRYGPFSLKGAKDATVSFWYWLDTEAYYDEFGWQVSCDGLKTWTGTEVSGSVKAWVKVTMSLKSCVGKAKVWVRWTFRSDYSSPSAPRPQGVWLDDIRIRKSV
jgi:hypothetical protein